MAEAARRRASVGFGGGKAEQRDEFGQRCGIGAAPEFERTLDSLVVEIAIHRGGDG